MGLAGKIVSIDPAFGIPGGEIVIECEGLDTTEPSSFSVLFDDMPAPLVALGPKRVLAIVPETKQGGTVAVTMQSGSDRSAPVNFIVGKKLAGDLHPVSNP